MYFKGDVIITDPCYIARKEETYKDIASKPKWADYITVKYDEDRKLFREQSVKLEKAEKEWQAKNPDDWDKCNGGRSMHRIGIKTYLSDSTRYGDWSCTTWQTGFKKPKPIGRFCADAGLVAVFLLDEVLAYNPDFDYHIDRPWTTTLIKDFDGDINIEFFEEDDEVRVVGKGNINFITTQTGF